jgi:hypothetical protein
VLADDSAPAALSIKVSAEAWESQFIDAGDFQKGLSDEDIPDIQSVEIRSFMSGRQITATFSRPATPQQNQQPKADVAELNVAGPDKNWVRDATEALTKTIESGVPRSGRVFKGILYAGLALLAIGTTLAITGSEQHVGWLQTAGVVILLVGIGLFFLGAIPEGVLPGLEILPEGKQTKRSRALRLAKREAAWLTRSILSFALGVGLTLLYQRLT